MKRRELKTIINQILSFFISSPKKKFNYRQILSKLPYKINKNKIKEVLFLLEKENKIKHHLIFSFAIILKMPIFAFLRRRGA